eukprot:3145891-Pleurochrysis_carterae.AAC.1
MCALCRSSSRSGRGGLFCVRDATGVHERRILDADGPYRTKLACLRMNASAREVKSTRLLSVCQQPKSVLQPLRACVRALA